MFCRWFSISVDEQKYLRGYEMPGQIRMLLVEGQTQETGRVLARPLPTRASFSVLLKKEKKKIL